MYRALPAPPSRRFGGLVVVAALHLIAGWALTNGLARKVVEVLKQPIETKIIEEVKPPPPPPENLPPPPKSAPPPPSFVPPPEVVVTPPPTPAPTITTTQAVPPSAPVTIAPAPAPEATPAPPTMPVAARPAIANAQACAPRAEDYPPAAVRTEAVGVTRIRFSIDAEGKLVNAVVVKSAGNSREHRMLDKLALDKLSTCKFTPGTDTNGRPVGASFDFEYVWRLRD